MEPLGWDLEILGGEMLGYCDSCTEEREVKGYEVEGADFYWCEDCAE